MDDYTTTDHRHHQHHKPSNDSVSTQSSSSSLNTHHKSRAARIDDQSRFNKVLSRSVIADSLHYFLPKPNSNPNPTLIRTVSDSTKMSQPNPDKERWRRKVYGGEIVKLIYEKKLEKKATRKAEEEEVEMRLSEMDVSEVRKGGDGAMKRVSRRRSFCGEETSLISFLSSNGARIVAVDMPPFMQIHAIDCARKAYDSLEKFTSKSLALSLKKEFDGVYGPAWHCIVGTSFGSFVTHSVGGFLYFSLDHKMYILLFKTTVQRAD